MNDATRIVDLLAHGLIRASLVPPTPIQELRDLTQARRQLVQERTRYVLRIKKVLEDAKPDGGQREGPIAIRTNSIYARSALAAIFWAAGTTSESGAPARYKR